MAGSAYLTVSENFPLKIRTPAIAIFYGIGTLAGGVGAPTWFGAFIGIHSRPTFVWGYFGAAALMLLAAAIEVLLGVKAEWRSLESISAPLSSH